MRMRHWSTNGFTCLFLFVMLLPFFLSMSTPAWSEPMGQCSVFNACGEFGSCNDKNGNETMCKCLPGFEMVQPDLGDFSPGCRRKSLLCEKNGDNSPSIFLNLKMMKAGRPDRQIWADSEKQCRQECLNDCRCQAYWFKLSQHQTESNTSTCYIWSEDLENIQEFVEDGHDLYVRVPLSDIESTSRSCGTCGTNVFPYPLSTGGSCGDPLYATFSCDNKTGQLFFERPQGRHRVTSVVPEARTFTVQVNKSSDCDLVDVILQLNQSSPLQVSSGCSGGKNDSLGSSWLSEVKIVWLKPKEPICSFPKDCLWPHTTCKRAPDGMTRCLCNLGFSWKSSSFNCSPVADRGSSQKEQKVQLVYVVAPTGVAIFLLLVGALFCMRRLLGIAQGSRGRAQENPQLHLQDMGDLIRRWMESPLFEEDDKKDIDVPSFNFETIQLATNNFSGENELGRGGFGLVYKATILGGQEIAVKRLMKGSAQGLTEFKSEVILIGKLQHRNLVRLVGYCVEGDEKMLLYEYMPNKSLDSFIFDRTRCLLLTWKMRFDIIWGIAQGRLYLHEHSRLRIIHNDIKTSNVLLDEEMTPKISDFGLARIFEAKQTDASTQRMFGTYGYMSPEYGLSGVFSVKSDVYRFGVVVLETVSGKRNTRPLSVSRNTEPSRLCEYSPLARELWNDDKALDLMDQALHATYNGDEVLKCIKVGLSCVQDDPSNRPTMSDAVLMLHGGHAALPDPKRPTFTVRRGPALSLPESCTGSCTRRDHGSPSTSTVAAAAIGGGLFGASKRESGVRRVGNRHTSHRMKGPFQISNGILQCPTHDRIAFP